MSKKKLSLGILGAMLGLAAFAAAAPANLFEVRTGNRVSGPIVVQIDSAGNMKTLEKMFIRKPIYPIVAVTANTTLTAANASMVGVGAIAGNITITLPSAILVGAGREITFFDAAGNITVQGNVTINATAGTLNNASSAAFATQYGRKRAISDGANWWVQ